MRWKFQLPNTGGRGCEMAAGRDGETVSRRKSAGKVQCRLTCVSPKSNIYLHSSLPATRGTGLLSQAVFIHLFYRWNSQGSETIACPRSHKESRNCIPRWHLLFVVTVAVIWVTGIQKTRREGAELRRKQSAPRHSSFKAFHLVDPHLHREVIGVKW